MADAPYLIALALLEQDGQRAMPLQGKSLREPIAADADPGDVGQQQVLELLLRIWQRSDQGPLRRLGGELSLLLVAVPIEALQEQLPQIKADWLNSGDQTALITALGRLGSGLWRLEQQPRQAPRYERLA